MDIVTAYHDALITPSDIQVHLPTLFALALECNHITELGTRYGISTTAFLCAQPTTFICYDLVGFDSIIKLASLAGRTAFEFRCVDVLAISIAKTDLLFIDTKHDYDQLRLELALHATKASVYIVVHDTTRYAMNGESAGQRGIQLAIDEFVMFGEFRVKYVCTDDNGLTVLERINHTNWCG